ncbi:hypothetical protein ACH46L_30335 [Streptomyces althioticus]|uniref:hypothetical protein n=1 Tax=Streptomyces althioticus TaxID=83380 RepID=UPI0037B342B0
MGEDTWVPLGAGLTGPEADRLLTALRVLVQAGPEARRAVEEAGRLVPELDRQLLTALPAAKLRLLLVMDREGRADARAAVRRLREMVTEAERSGRWLRFLQTSIDLLRGPDADPLALSARVDLASRPDAYQEQLWHVVRTRPALTR